MKNGGETFYKLAYLSILTSCLALVNSKIILKLRFQTLFPGIV